MGEEEIYLPSSRDGEKVTVNGKGRDISKKYKGKSGVIAGQTQENWATLVRFENGDEESFFPDELSPG